VHTVTVENAGFELALVQWLVLRHELPDQHVVDHRIITSYGLIAPLVTMSCRLLLRRVASRAAFYRASGLVLWPFSDMADLANDVRS
jgi:hypothetical protein